MRRAAAAILAALVMLPSAAHAQQASPSPRSLDSIGYASPTPIRDAAHREVERLAFTAAHSLQTQTPPRPRNWAARHPVLLGTMAGAGVGLGFLAAEGCDSSDYGCSGLIAFFAGTGAMLGAAGGLVASIFLR